MWLLTYKIQFRNTFESISLAHVDHIFPLCLCKNVPGLSNCERHPPDLDSGLGSTNFSSFSLLVIPFFCWHGSLSCWKVNFLFILSKRLRILCQNWLVFGAIYNSLHLDSQFQLKRYSLKLRCCCHHHASP